MFKTGALYLLVVRTRREAVAKGKNGSEWAATGGRSFTGGQQKNVAPSTLHSFPLCHSHYHKTIIAIFEYEIEYFRTVSENILKLKKTFRVTRHAS